ncbi:MAG: cyclic nucleotide-binding domain-containing protein [Chloroflexi bacterium]|nr:MAG: cyclic nucleotide-binding domain-containing protein [Chloroflexota bacterium]
MREEPLDRRSQEVDEDMDAARLRSIPLFAALDDKQRKVLAAWMDEVDLPAGKRLMGEGTFAYEFAILESGTASVVAGDRKLRDLGPGDFFGEIGLLASERRTASVETTSPARAIVMTGANFRAMVRELPQVAERVQRAIEERIGRTA